MPTTRSMRSLVKDKKPNWQQQSAFSEAMSDLEIVLNRDSTKKTWAIELILCMFAFFACIFVTIQWTVDVFDYNSLRPSLGLFPSTSLPAASLLDQATSKEAYVIFLPSVDREDYVLSAKVLLYGFKHDEDTRDPGRDVVIMTTPQVPAALEDQLREEGAIIARHESITSIPNPFDLGSDHRWKDMYNKLLAWNMTQYERVLITDTDMLMARSLKGIWDEPFARPKSGIAGVLPASAPPEQPYKEYINGGFLLAMPNRTMFEELLLVRDFAYQTPGMNDIEQALLNKYFRRDGPHPWVEMDNIWIKNSPDKSHLEKGYHMLHEKCWMHGWDRELTTLWRKKLGKMRGYHDAMRTIRERAKNGGKSEP